MDKDRVVKLIEAKEYKKGLNILNKQLGKSQFDIEALALRAKIYYRQQEFEKAIIEYSELINLDPANLDHIADRGLAFHMSGNHDKALEDFDLVIDRDSLNPYWFACRAFIKDYIKDFHGSLNDYDRALELDPEDAISLNNKGLVEEKLGYAERAKASFVKADELQGIDLDKEIGHLNIPIEEDEVQSQDQGATTSPVSNNGLRNYLNTLRSLVTSSSERQEFIDFILRRKK